MGVPTSAILAETFIQCSEHKKKKINILNEHQIIDYHRNVDYILIIYNTHTANIENTLTKFKALHKKKSLSQKQHTRN
jgi:hypothetical protein